MGLKFDRGATAKTNSNSKSTNSNIANSNNSNPNIANSNNANSNNANSNTISLPGQSTNLVQSNDSSESKYLIVQNIKLNISSLIIDTFQDFLIAEHMKPCMHILKIRISSQNHVIVRPTKTPKLADKKCAQFY